MTLKDEHGFKVVNKWHLILKRWNSKLNVHILHYNGILLTIPARECQWPWGLILGGPIFLLVTWTPWAVLWVQTLYMVEKVQLHSEIVYNVRELLVCTQIFCNKSSIRKVNKKNATKTITTAWWSQLLVFWVRAGHIYPLHCITYRYSTVPWGKTQQFSVTAYLSCTETESS